MGKRVFVSYCHAQADWVIKRLVPLLRAASAHITLDIHNGTAGVALNAQMDAWVDGCDVMLAVVSPEYLDSKACRYEWERMLARDPDFLKGTLAPIQRAGDVMPDAVKAMNPLYVDLRDDVICDPEDPTVNGYWDKILKAVEGDLGVPALAWLDALGRVVTLIEGKQSVNLVASSPAKWKELLNEAHDRIGSISTIDLGDVANGHSKRCFFAAVLGALGADSALPEKPKNAEIVEFSKRVRKIDHARLSIVHFERCWKWKDIDGDFFDALRTHTTRDISRPKIDLSLIVHSTEAISTKPAHDPVSRWQPVEVILNRPQR